MNNAGNNPSMPNINHRKPPNIPLARNGPIAPQAVEEPAPSSTVQPGMRYAIVPEIAMMARGRTKAKYA